MAVISRANIFQVAKFGTVGALNTGVDFAVFFALHRWLGVVYAAAQVVSYLSGVTNSYVFNRFWTFQKSGGGLGPVKFLVVNVASLSVSLLVLYLLKDRMQLDILPSKIVATAFAMLVNFSGSKFWAFR